MGSQLFNMEKENRTKGHGSPTHSHIVTIPKE